MAPCSARTHSVTHVPFLCIAETTGFVSKKGIGGSGYFGGSPGLGHIPSTGGLTDLQSSGNFSIRGFSERSLMDRSMCPPPPHPHKCLDEDAWPGILQIPLLLRAHTCGNVTATPPIFHGKVLHHPFRTHCESRATNFPLPQVGGALFANWRSQGKWGKMGVGTGQIVGVLWKNGDNSAREAQKASFWCILGAVGVS